MRRFFVFFVLFVSSWFLSSWLQAAPARRVTFRAEDGAMLNGAYYEPSRRPAPGIVLLPMLRRTHADWDAAASQLSDAGFAVVALDYRGGDEIGAYALDVRAAKAFLRERPEVIGNSLGIAGASIGANLAVLDAADDPGVLSIALLSPGIDYKGLRTDAAMKRFGARPALACRQHQRSVRGSIDPSTDHDRPGSARSAPDRLGGARNRAPCARSRVDRRIGGLVQTHAAMIPISGERTRTVAKPE